MCITHALPVFALAFVVNCDGIADSEDFYELLGLDRSATDKDVKRAYKQLALKYHPDKNPDEDATKVFIKIQRAYEVLSDPEKRKRYDARGARQSFFTSDEGEWDEDADVHAPDFGRGKVVKTSVEFETLRSSGQFLFVHVYADNSNYFGSWMARLPEEITLLHVNYQTAERVLMQFLGIRRIPVFLFVQRDRSHQFVPSHHAIFFGVLNFVLTEALGFVDYWSNVQRLRSEAEVLEFLEFSPGASARCRVIFVGQNEDDRHWGAFILQQRMAGLVHIGQLGYREFRMRGEEKLFHQFGIRRLASVIIWDPVTKLWDVTTRDDDAAEIVERLLRQMPPQGGNQLHFVPEIDSQYYKWRCGENAKDCDYVFLVSTPASLENDGLASIMQPFLKACRSMALVQARISSAFGCFWLRLGRTSAAWSVLLGEAPSDGSLRVAALSNNRNEVSMTSTKLGDRGLMKWFQLVINSDPSIESISMGSDWPPFPEPAELVAGLDLQNMDWKSLKRELQRVLQKVFEIRDEKVQELKALMWRHGFREEEAQVLLFMGPMTFLMIFVLFLGCCTGSSAPSTLQETLDKMQWKISVTLQRKQGDKLGFGIRGGEGEKGMLGISEVAEGGLLEHWNRLQAYEWLRVQQGDRIASVNGATELRGMAEALRSNDTVVKMHVVPCSRTMERFVSVVVLHNLNIEQCVGLVLAPDNSGTYVVKVVKPSLEEQNKKFRAEGRCSTQIVEVGDRIVSVGEAIGREGLEQNLKTVSPAITMVKWRPKGFLESMTIEVSAQRQNVLEERWGLDLRPRAPLGDTSCLEVRRMVAGGVFGGSQIRPGDCLIAANGRSLSEGLSSELTKLSVTLRLQRWIEKSNSTGDGSEHSSNCKAGGQDQSDHDLGKEMCDRKAQEERLRSCKKQDGKNHSQTESFSNGTDVIDDGWDVCDLDLGEQIDSSKKDESPSNLKSEKECLKNSESEDVVEGGWDFELEDFSMRNECCSDQLATQAAATSSADSSVSHSLAAEGATTFQTVLQPDSKVATDAPDQASEPSTVSSYQQPKQRPATRSKASGSAIRPKVKAKVEAAGAENGEQVLDGAAKENLGSDPLLQIRPVCSVDWWPPHGSWRNVMSALS